MVKIYLDPGHGGSDTGAVGQGLQEKHVTLAFALKIRNILNNRYQGHQIRMSRSTDSTVSLAARTNDANQWGADYFISIHINAGGGAGYEDYIHSNLSNQGTTGKYRKIMHEEIIKQANLQNRGRKQANSHVLRESSMPAFLTENGFIDHAADAAKLKSDTILEQIALGHARGIARVFQLSAKSSPGSSSSLNSSNNQGKTSISKKQIHSVVDYLKSIGEDSSFTNRARLARSYGISNYTGTAAQNTRLLKAVKSGNPSNNSSKLAARRIHLPASASTWRTYPLNVTPVKKNSDWSLTPAAFGGLTYDILAEPYPNVVTIQTGRGRRNIYVGPDTSARRL
ncbi:N-acetylmuramoyl-L-alanine amidase [Oceanobacillus sojae]|uniref:N-acetylmuramoyl-L-alanine amidase n=1 Tax=Oceanobacillus sojae TaxID=582851 RepID=UPI0036296A6F